MINERREKGKKEERERGKENVFVKEEYFIREKTKEIKGKRKGKEKKH